MRMIYIIVSPVRAFQLDLYDGRRHALLLPTTQQEIRDEAQQNSWRTKYPESKESGRNGNAIGIYNPNGPGRTA